MAGRWKPMLRPSFEELARRFVPGDGPVRIDRLADCGVNDSRRVVRAGLSYVLRVSGADHEIPGVDRDWECRVANLAAAHGMGPAVRACEARAGVLVTEWVPGRSWSAAEAAAAPALGAMAGLLRRVHALEPPTPVRSADPAAWIDRYAGAIDAGRGADRRHARESRTADFAAAAAWCLQRLAQLPAARPVLCHSDLHRQNVVAGERLVLLDWEYAHVADPYWDLAGWVVNNDGDPRFAFAWLTQYLGRAPCDDERLRLTLFAWLYDYVAWLWSAVYARRASCPGAAAVAQRAAVLATRLASGFGGRGGQVPAHYPP